MRRPRSKLQVSTFPFLAVLLCAMGALLLLLFIMDRRAKIAAQHSVSDAVAERKKRTQEEEAARQAEWEKATALLHQSLLEKEGELAGAADKIQVGLSDADKKRVIVQSQHVELEGKIQAESAQIARLQAYIASKNAGLNDVDKKETKSKIELLQATKELAELELAFRRLKALRDRDKDTYSMVPYRGKHGDLRTPIYVECLRGGVIFHPEKKLLEHWDFTADTVRAEVERRTGPLAIERSVSDKRGALAQEHKGPYVLFLVRPNGIGAYYLAQAALKGYQIDFGYEFVDEQWVIDFNGDPNANQAPLAVAKTADTQRPNWMPARPGFGMGRAGQGGQPNGASMSGGPNPGFAGSGVGVSMNGGVGSGPPGSAGGVGSGPPGSAGGVAMNGGVGSGSGGPLGVPGGIGLPAIGGNPGMPAALPRLRLSRGARNRYRHPQQGPGLRAHRPTAIAGGDRLLRRRRSRVSLQRRQLAQAGWRRAVGRFHKSSGGRNPRARQLAWSETGRRRRCFSRRDCGERWRPLTRRNRRKRPLHAGISQRRARRTRHDRSHQRAKPRRRQRSPRKGPASKATQGQSQGQGVAGDSEADGGLPGPRGVPMFGGSDGPKKPPLPASPLSKLLGNKDFIITIECYADHVTISPSGLQYRWNTGNAAANDQALTQTVTNLIARRQASVRPGEPPYRPILRFQVAADGYPTFYRAYPLLEHLHVAWTKENIRD